jgi:hypothetical protein
MHSRGSDLIFPMATDLYRRAFARAANILGGRKQLAKHLGIDPHLLDKWSTPAARPPEYVLQFLAQLLRTQLLKKYRSFSKTFSARTTPPSSRRKKAGGR